MLDVCATTSTDAVLQSAGSALMVPDHSSNWPRTLLTMWRIVNESSEWATSIFQVGSVLTADTVFGDWACAVPCATASAGSSAANIVSLRIIFWLWCDPSTSEWGCRSSAPDQTCRPGAHR